jgi:hypothetical protein
MAHRVRRSITTCAADCGAKRCVAVLALVAVIAALGQPLLTLGLGGDPTYCCRSGRCCCDSGKDSPTGLDLKAACRCARPDGTALAVALPAGVLAPGSTLTPPALADPLARPPAPAPRAGERPPPDQPPRLSRAT